MGTYTELHLNLKLRKNIPIEIKHLFEKVVNNRDLEVNGLFSSQDVFVPDVNHSFFKCDRWYMLFLGNNFCGEVGISKFIEDKYYYSLIINSEFKNYDNEINEFIVFITPYTIGRKKKQYIGWSLREDNDKRENIYIIK